MRRSQFLFLACCSVFLFVGCKNFLTGSLLKSELEESINYANAASYTIKVAPEKADYGQCNVSSITMKNTDQAEISFSLSSGYIFKSWQSSDPEAISFEDKYSLTTTITMIDGHDDIKITPLCVKSLAISSITPAVKIHRPLKILELNRILQ
ncbi:MAG: hypothetical protein K5866_11565 [Treponema sp.]|nr:hypothetical protein [Treponema sp.]